jgi:hypothetical protein
MATFNIGNQQAAVINNVGRDLHVGELHAEAQWRPVELRAELVRLQEELSRLALPTAERAAIQGALSAAAEDARPGGDPGRAVSALARATRLLTRTGALATAGAGLMEALNRAAAALGPAGAAVTSALSAI